jgi:lipid-binding SYLF domain-containing protein
MAEQTLAQVYAQYPHARRKVEEAKGYAVFSNFGMKFLYMGSATGSGLAVDNATKKVSFMKMVELQPGYGFGVQNFRNVFVFETREAFYQFVDSGWEFGGKTTAALHDQDQGILGGFGVNVSPGVVMYQISESGAIVGVSVTGAKYYQDDQLN